MPILSDLLNKATHFHGLITARAAHLADTIVYRLYRNDDAEPEALTYVELLRWDN